MASMTKTYEPIKKSKFFVNSVLHINYGSTVHTRNKELHSFTSNK